MTTLTVDLLPKQLEFLEAPAREVLYSGAFGAGKTRAVCIKACMRAQVPGAREALVRKHLVTLKATTLKTLLEPDGALPPILPVGTYAHNQSAKTIRLKEGGEIVYFGLDDPAKIGSYGLTGVGIDEAVELTEADWTALRGRCRVALPGLPNQIYGACNPGSPSHFLAERFGLALDYRAVPNCRAVRTRSTDNWYLPPDYLADLATFTGVARARYVEGQWVGSEGLVYAMWDRMVFVRTRPGPFTRYVLGVDDGYSNAAALLLLGLDGDGRLHLMREWYHAKRLPNEVVAAAAAIVRGADIDWAAVDPSAAKLIAQMQAGGLPAKPADNDVLGGVRAVQNRLCTPADGLPRLTIDPTCEHTIREFETYEWMPDPLTGAWKDRPVKAHDHAMDALRYAVVSIDGIAQPHIYGLRAGEDEERQAAEARMEADAAKHPDAISHADLRLAPPDEPEPAEPSDHMNPDNDDLWE